MEGQGKSEAFLHPQRPRSGEMIYGLGMQLDRGPSVWNQPRCFGIQNGLEISTGHPFPRQESSRKPCVALRHSGHDFFCGHCSLFRLKASSTQRKELQNPRWVYKIRFEGTYCRDAQRTRRVIQGRSQPVVISSPGST